MVNSYDLDPIEGARMYRRKAFDFHLPRVLICASHMPRDAAHDAAPILKLCDLYPETSKSQTRRESAKAFVKKFRETEERSAQQNIGPRDEPLRFK